MAGLPPVLLGVYVGHRVHVNIKEVAFRRLVSITLILSGALLLI